MRRIKLRAFALLAALMLAASVQGAGAQTTTAAFAPHELESLVAPVALYPDELLANVLMASTYPLDVIAAVRWLNQPENAALTGDALVSSLAAIDWDPSVKALVAAPQVLRMMESRIDWVVRLGDAFVVDQSRVMDAVQRLRRQARANGDLKSDANRRVVVDSDGAILIEPASTQALAVDIYQPLTVYGAWEYPDSPPVYIEPPPEYVAVPIITYPVIVPLWGWSSWDWQRHHIRLDVPRWSNLDRGHSHIVFDNKWEHDPSRRRRFGGTTPGVLPPANPAAPPPVRPANLPPGLTPGDPRRGGGQGFGRRDDHEREGLPSQPRQGATPSTLAVPNAMSAAPSTLRPSPTPSIPAGTPSPNLTPGRFRHDGDEAPAPRPNVSVSPPGLVNAPVVLSPPRTPDPPRVYVSPAPPNNPPPRLGAPAPTAPVNVAPQPRPGTPAAGDPPKVVCSTGPHCPQL